MGRAGGARVTAAPLSRALVAEAVGTYLLVLFGTGSVAAGHLHNPGNLYAKGASVTRSGPGAGAGGAAPAGGPAPAPSGTRRSA